MRYKFLDIGTSCFATSIDDKNFKAGEDNGILVEPIKKYLDAIPEIEGVIKANYAISNYCGNGTMYAPTVSIDNLEYTSQEYFEVENKELRQQYGKAGSNSLNKIHPNIHKFNQEFDTVACTVITLDKLCDIYEIDEVESIKIDTEGHESIVLSQLIDLMKAKKIKVLNSIKFESNYLNDQTDLRRLSETICKEFMFENLGVFGRDQNVILKKCHN